MAGHGIERRGGQVVKRFRSCDLDQPRREWEALVLLARHAPGLAPDPIAFCSDGPSPAVVMSRVEGDPLRGGRVLAHQVTAMAAAVAELWDAIPPAQLARLPARPWQQAEIIGLLETWCEGPLPGDAAPVVRRARAEGLRWLRTARFTSAARPTLGTGDGNLSNFLWDGQRVHLVDFEYSGQSDRAYELAEVVEHVATWVDTEFDGDAFLECFALGRQEARRLSECRRLGAFEWLHVLSDQEPGTINPVGTVERQAERLLVRLGAG